MAPLQVVSTASLQLAAAARKPGGAQRAGAQTTLVHRARVRGCTSCPGFFSLGSSPPGQTPRDHGFGALGTPAGHGQRTRAPSLYVQPRVRWRSAAQVSSSRCSAAKLGFELRFFNFSLRSFSVSLSLSPVLTRLGSIWWLVLGRTKGYLGDMRVSETCVPHKKEYLKL